MAAGAFSPWRYSENGLRLALVAAFQSLEGIGDERRVNLESRSPSFGPGGTQL